MTTFWAFALALVTLLYVVLDGFDLGIGIIFGVTRSPQDRLRMLAAISPVWDGNETWLVLAATILFGAFSKVYAALFSAFYLPVLFMVCALILRGVAFEFRYKTTRLRWVWDLAFTGGSWVATFMQGLTVGQLVQGLPLVNGAYVGGPLHWLNPFSALCGLGLCAGYALLGSAWLIAKCEGAVRARAYTLLPLLLATVLVFLVAVFVFALGKNLPIMNRWVERPWLAVFPAIGLAAVINLVLHLRRQDHDHVPFLMGALIFASAFGTLGASFWPYMIPFSMTIDQAANPQSSQAFMFWGAGIVVLPLTLIYTVLSYRVFRGKVSDEGGYH
jgi:cytochrome d ubiquinol oxidase subunit II